MAEKKLILLTNDDGIRSPGLWAAAGALEPLGFVAVVAPREQSTGAGRSMPASSEGRLYEETVSVNGKAWQVYAADGAPAQAVQHGLLEILPRLPDLVVSGINYGENVGSGVTISGTVGAAFEGASFGVPSLAVSLQTELHYHRSHSTEIDFSTAAYFTQKFARLLLSLTRPPDVDVLKVEIPEGAAPQTSWRVTRLSRTRYFLPTKPARRKLADTGRIGYQRLVEPHLVEPDSDVRALMDGVVSVTPLSLDMTSRVDLAELASLLQQNGPG
jgi:5'-nucleotidase